ncbi:uncharacterized protein si:ch1073-126c3.2 isoform X3 [Betta splendens]|uniref:Uncharacterized protein si:ch1073-126c3.2 isoform X3 n=1 Tax=Betta splendens TaxID=158456 RepID=A0A6P7KM11_BETSP|nr:uncharacterized protein si:ch1073-126c3.2 isoform X3 [Betta splendens]
MGFKGAVIWICSLAALSLPTAKTTDETSLPTCNSTQLYNNLSADLKQVAVECGGNLLSVWTEQQRTQLLLSLNNLTESLHKLQLKDTNKCPKAKVPENGGLVCVTVASKRYCKPLCNHGYDFGFIRRSRLFEECSEQTRYQWSSQYVGGNALAVCNKAIQVAGAKSAYFPEGQNCQTTKSNEELEKSISDTFSTELRNQGIEVQLEVPSLQCHD